MDERQIKRLVVDDSVVNALFSLLTDPTVCKGVGGGDKNTNKIVAFQARSGAGKSTFLTAVAKKDDNVRAVLNAAAHDFFDKFLPVTVTFNYYGTPLVEGTCKYGMLEFTSRFILRCVDLGACTLAWEVV